MNPKLAAVFKQNASVLSSLRAERPVAIFVGGTSGVGQGLAEDFARHRMGRAHIVVVGRNEQAANEILTRTRSLLDPPDQEVNWTHEFVQCDLTLMRNVHAASKEILTRYPKINYLLMTPGFFSTAGREETDEGLDKKLAVHYYGRWKFIDELLPALRKAKDEGEDVRVMSVFSAGFGSQVDLNDIGLEKTYTIWNAGRAAATYNDLMIEV